MKSMHVACSVVASVLLSASLLSAQTTGTLLGTVTDQSNAVLPGASVQATNVETGIQRNTISGNNGQYRIPSLQPGSYEVQVSLPGFRSEVRRPAAPVD